MDNSSEHSISHESLFSADDDDYSRRPRHRLHRRRHHGRHFVHRATPDTAAHAVLSASAPVLAVPTTREVTPTHSPSSNVICATVQDRNQVLDRGRPGKIAHDDGDVTVGSLPTRSQRHRQRYLDDPLYAKFHRSATIPIHTDDEQKRNGTQSDAERELRLYAQMKDHRLYSRMVRGAQKRQKQLLLYGNGSIDSASFRLENEAFIESIRRTRYADDSGHECECEPESENKQQREHGSHVRNNLSFGSLHNNDVVDSEVVCRDDQRDFGAAPYCHDSSPSPYVDRGAHGDNQDDEYWDYPYEERADDPSEHSEVFELEL